MNDSGDPLRANSADILEVAHAIIEDYDNWLVGAFANMKGQFCVLGSLDEASTRLRIPKVYGVGRSRAYFNARTALYGASIEVFGAGPAEVNDGARDSGAPHLRKARHAAVLDLLKRALANVKVVE